MGGATMEALNPLLGQSRRWLVDKAKVVPLLVGLEEFFILRFLFEDGHQLTAES